jgi:hypothetical protein
MKLQNEKIRRRRKTFFVAIFFAVVLFAGLMIDLFETRNEAGTVLGDKETVTILSPTGSVSVTAKIDTGADFSSIDSSLADSLNLKTNTLKRGVTSAQGKQVRDTVVVEYIIGNKQISSIFSVADRSNLSTDVLIGRSDMQGFTVDPNREFLNEPQFPLKSLTLHSLFARVTNRSVSKQIVVLPILGALVVLLRLVVGLRTFGIFAPVVIALSLILMQPNIIQGIIIYMLLISIGVAMKLLVFGRMNLPNIAEMSLIMSVSLLSLVVFSFFPLSFQLTTTTVFFPLIITTHIIERFSRISEENKLSEAMNLLFHTLVTALLLTFIGSYLVNLNIGIIWIIFFISIFVVIAIGNYTGLRLSEFLRFKFLKKK